MVRTSVLNTFNSLHYSGKFNVRLLIELHGAIATEAASQVKNLNQWVRDALSQVIKPPSTRT